MRDIKIVKLPRGKSTRQYKVFNNTTNQNSRTARKKKIVNEKKMADVANKKLKDLRLSHNSRALELFKETRNVNQVSMHGKTLLHFACSKNDLFFVNTLLEQRADISIRDNMGNNPLAEAVINGALEVTENLIPRYFLRQHVSTSDNIPLLVIAMHNASHDIETTGNCWLTTDEFHSSGWNEPRTLTFGGVFKFLLEYYQGRVNNWHNLFNGEKQLALSTCKRGNTLLHYACEYNLKTAVVKLLQVNRELLAIKNRIGDRALHVCCRYNLTEIARILMESRQLDINEINKQDYSPLAIACKHGNREMATMLVNNKASINNVLQVYKQTASRISSIYILIPLRYDTVLPLHLIPVLISSGANMNANTTSDFPLDYIISAHPMKKYSESENKKLKKDIQYMITAGAYSQNALCLQQFESSLRDEEDNEFLRFMLESGHRFRISLQMPEILDQSLRRPYGLSTLCGKVIRTNLFPNAWVSVDKLPIPKALKNLVVMDYGGYNMNFK